MKNFSIFIAFAISIGGINAFSQVTSETSVKGSELKGLYVGLEYANLTDISLKGSFKSNFDGSTSSVDSKGGTHLGVVGLSAGYKMMNVNGNQRLRGNK